MFEKIKALALLRFTIIKSLFDIFINYEISSDEQNKESLEYNLLMGRCFDLVADMIDLKLSSQIFFESALGKTSDLTNDRAVEYFIRSSLFKDEIIASIGEKLGKIYAGYYYQLMILFTIHYLSAFHIYEIEIPEHRQQKMDEQFDFLNEFVTTQNEIGWQIDKINGKNYFNNSVLENLAQLSIELRNTQNRNWKQINNIAANLLNEIFDDYPNIIGNIAEANDLFDELRKCPAGANSWREYENISTKIVRYLFIPPFKKVHIQSATATRDQRRDIVLSNHQHSGFWKNIRDEFAAKNIVIECKNGASAAKEKESINQLRIYLSKPTIGRFGMLFIRSKPQQQLSTARKNAYSENGILILIFDDKLVEKLLLCKALFGTCEDVIETEKVKFELSY